MRDIFLIWWFVCTITMIVQTLSNLETLRNIIIKKRLTNFSVFVVFMFAFLTCWFWIPINVGFTLFGRGDGKSELP